MADVENQPPSLKGRKWNRDSAFDILQDQALISAVGLARQTAHNDPERSKKISIGLMKHNYNNNNGRTPKQMEAWEQNRFKGNQKGVKRKPEHVSHLPGNTYAKKTPLEVPLSSGCGNDLCFEIESIEQRRNSIQLSPT